MLMHAKRAILLIVDVQTRLAPAIAGAEACLERCRLLLEAARRLEVPVLASEQYPEGLGPTVPALAERLAPDEIHAKLCFAGTIEPAIRAALAAHRRDQLVVCGMEAHVCVLQSALAARVAGFEVAVVADAVASRVPENRELALARMRGHGIEIVAAEMVVFEWLGRAGTADFKALAPLIK